MPNYLIHCFFGAVVVVCLCGMSFALGFRNGKVRTFKRLCRNGELDVKRFIAVNDAFNCISNIIGWALRLRRCHEDLGVGGDTVKIPAEWLKQGGVELTDGDGSSATARERHDSGQFRGGRSDGETVDHGRTKVEHHHPIVRIRSKPPWDW